MAKEIRNNLGNGLEVSRVIVSAGELVERGDTLVILHHSATDEGYPVTTNVSGVVAKVPVAEGEVIKQGDLIAVIE
jgi:multidrug efflux pump subunit AcrA (membrane-fusion protein)